MKTKNETTTNRQLESVKATMRLEGMPLIDEEIEICRKILSGEISADQVCKKIIEQYSN